jgi:hypothetical protein
MADLNTEIVAYLTVNNIAFTSADYQTGQPEGQPNQILLWNTATLGAQPTQEQLDSAWNTKLAQDAAIAYKAQRAAEYPSIVDQLDLLFHGGIDGWKAAIQAVKDKYPKP